MRSQPHRCWKDVQVKNQAFLAEITRDDGHRYLHGRAEGVAIAGRGAPSATCSGGVTGAGHAAQHGRRLEKNQQQSFFHTLEGGRLLSGAWQIEKVPPLVPMCPSVAAHEHRRRSYLGAELSFFGTLTLSFPRNLKATNPYFNCLACRFLSRIAPMIE